MSATTINAEQAFKELGQITRSLHQAMAAEIESIRKRAQVGLAGPQVPAKALQQDDVDNMLASLGF